MKKLWSLLVIIVLLVGCTNVGMSKVSKEKSKSEKESYENSDDINELWKITVKDYLKDDLWLERDIYDAGHFLMVPLHYAYQNEDPIFMRDFEKHFDKFIKSGVETLDINEDSNRLATLQYYYLLSRYIVLAESSNSPVINETNVDYLANFLLSEIKTLWEAPAWQWGREPFQNGMKERLMWKIENTEVNPSYYRAIIDEELFTMAIAADLKQYFKDDPTLKEISNVTYRVFKSESHFDTEGRWSFQVGVWTDHPDYVFAGYEDKDKITGDEKKVEDIVQDTSHSHRFPLWINSFANSFKDQTNEKEFYEKVLNGLEQQFFDKVMIPPNKETPFYRLTNYMNGYNGMFRWKYNTANNDGYGPFELSGTFTIGWWTFLGSERIKSAYADLADQFPLPQEAVDMYVGPNTTRDRNPFIADPDSYYNGYKKLLSLLAAKIE